MSHSQTPSYQSHLSFGSTPSHYPAPHMPPTPPGVTTSFDRYLRRRIRNGCSFVFGTVGWVSYLGICTFHLAPRLRIIRLLTCLLHHHPLHRKASTPRSTTWVRVAWVFDKVAGTGSHSRVQMVVDPGERTRKVSGSSHASYTTTRCTARHLLPAARICPDTTPIQRVVV
jgi:hypothetical protein